MMFFATTATITAILFGAACAFLLYRNCQLNRSLSNMEYKHAALVDASSELIGMIPNNTRTQFDVLVKACEDKLRIKNWIQPLVDAGTDGQRESNAEERAHVHFENARMSLLHEIPQGP